MAVLLGAFAILFVLELAIRFWPWPFVSLTELSITLVASIGWGFLVIGSGVKLDLLYGLATAGGVTVLHSAFRLVRAWADRTESANLLPIRQGRM